MPTEWIDVTERLPDIDTVVLAWIAEETGRHREIGCVLAQYNKWGKWEWQAFGDCYTSFTKTEITHWQELPKLVMGELIGDRLE